MPPKISSPLRLFPLEQWEEFTFEGRYQNRYAISNFGRIVYFTQEIKDGQLLKTYLSPRGYLRVKIKSWVMREGQEQKRTIAQYVHKLIAEKFLPNDQPQNKTVVLHLDYEKTNNHLDNLRWATRQEALQHEKTNPLWLASQQKAKWRGVKLNAATVQLLKKKLREGKTRQKILAKQFGVSEMAIYRIKKGENWKHID
jgi:HNH endonuclease/NUMOD4 motif